MSERIAAERVRRIAVGCRELPDSIADMLCDAASQLDADQLRIAGLTQERDAYKAAQEREFDYRREDVAKAEARIAELERERVAIQNQERILTCVYCGHAYPPGTPRSNHAALTAHVAVCPKHPAAAFRDRAERAEQRVAAQDAEIARLWAEREWQSIETAPKDGRRVLFAVPDEDGSDWATQVGWFDVDEDCWRYDCDMDGRPKYSVAHQPSRWMPLPVLRGEASRG